MPIKKRNIIHIQPVDGPVMEEAAQNYLDGNFPEDDPDFALYADKPEAVDEFEPLYEGADEEQTALIASAERFFGFSEGNRGEMRHPREVAVSELLRGVQTNMNAGDKEFGHIEEFYRNRIRSPLTAIRAWCVLSQGGPKKANDCGNVTCPLWAFRQGKNAFYGKNK